MARLNGVLESALPHRRVGLRKGRYDWEWAGDDALAWIEQQFAPFAPLLAQD